ncbi:hypothetical protein C0Q70_03290 [Pomacea canaliculata]|uniref:Kringle domain-containing protein n=1 Tax=Pomacea canaliculata TaxID=400727 RepID=A0A2T7PSB2_POMCA|nr:hypothetical protein C0Q70_03290 [Pomacea canaliculata]
MRKCVPWDSPGLPFLRKEDFPDGDMSHAHCRNPGASQSKPWCYTNATTLDFGYCTVPECKPTCPEPAPVANAYRSYRSQYVGTSVSYTCYHGYDNTAGNLSRVCQSNGTYSGDAPVCEFCVCFNAPTMPRLQITVTRTDDDPPTTRYVCTQGFYPVGGNATVRCLPNGEYVIDVMGRLDELRSSCRASDG